MKNETPKKKALLKELAGLGNLIRGSLVHGTRKCGKKTCSCANGGPEHPCNYLSISTTYARNRLVYVSKTNLATVEKGVAAYRRAREILEELSELNISELKGTSINCFLRLFTAAQSPAFVLFRQLPSGS